MVEREQVARWLDEYVRAWETYDASAIGQLFAEDASYRYHPWDDEPLRGRDAIVADWLANRDAPGSYQAEYRPAAVDGETAVATGTSRYFGANGQLEKVYENVFVMRFDDAGRCAEFVEYYMKRPDEALEKSGSEEQAA